MYLILNANDLAASLHVERQIPNEARPMNLKFSTSAFPLAVIALALATGPRAFATSTIEMTFNCTNSPGAVANGSGCTNSSTPATPITSWAQSGFNVGISGFGWNPNQGETGQGTGVTGAAGQGYFSLVGGTGSGSGRPAIGTFTVTDGGGLFDFDSIDLKATAAGTYEIQYYGANGQLIGADTQNGALSNANKYVTVDGELVEVTKVVITLDDTGVDYADYLDVNSPEPSSLLLLGSGMLALAFFVRRRLFV
jgi:hypothetical protein